LRIEGKLKIYTLFRDRACSEKDMYVFPIHFNRKKRACLWEDSHNSERFQVQKQIFHPDPLFFFDVRLENIFYFMANFRVNISNQLMAEYKRR